MSKGKVANLSCVDGFRSGSIEVGICVAQNMRAYQEDRWVSLIGKRRKAWNRLFDWGSSNSSHSSHSSSSSSSRSKEGWFFGKKKNQVGSTEEISSIVDNLSIFAVFDGHGGSECSEFATQQFQHILEDEFAKARSMEQTNGNGSTTTTQVLENTLFEIDKQFIQQQRRQTGIAQDAFKSPNHGGSTAVVVAISPQDHKITCSNIGDSRAIIIKTPVAGGIKGSNYLPLSSDHSPNIRPDEVLRIEKLGGKVQSNAMESALAHTIGVKVCPRVYQPNGVGGLNMTRALGDDYLKPLVIPDPETFELTMDNDDLYVVLASDGIWDALSNEDVTRMITDMHKDQGKLLHPSILVRKSALMLVQRAQLKGCQDNITCMVIRLPTVGK